MRQRGGKEFEIRRRAGFLNGAAFSFQGGDLVTKVPIAHDNRSHARLIQQIGDGALDRRPLPVLSANACVYPHRIRRIRQHLPKHPAQLLAILQMHQLEDAPTDKFFGLVSEELGARTSETEYVTGRIHEREDVGIVLKRLGG